MCSHLFTQVKLLSTLHFQAVSAGLVRRDTQWVVVDPTWERAELALPPTTPLTRLTPRCCPALNLPPDCDCSSSTAPPPALLLDRLASLLTVLVPSLPQLSGRCGTGAGPVQVPGLAGRARAAGLTWLPAPALLSIPLQVEVTQGEAVLGSWEAGAGYTPSPTHTAAPLPRHLRVGTVARTPWTLQHQVTARHKQSSVLQWFGRTAACPATAQTSPPHWPTGWTSRSVPGLSFLIFCFPVTHLLVDVKSQKLRTSTHLSKYPPTSHHHHPHILNSALIVSIMKIVSQLKELQIYKSLPLVNTYCLVNPG